MRDRTTLLPYWLFNNAPTGARGFLKTTCFFFFLILDSLVGCCLS